MTQITFPPPPWDGVLQRVDSLPPREKKAIPGGVFHRRRHDFDALALAVNLHPGQLFEVPAWAYDRRGREFPSCARSLTRRGLDGFAYDGSFYVWVKGSISRDALRATTARSSV